MSCMTKQVLLDVCKQHKLYRTPSLNDKLYLNFKGFTRIANLEEYTQLRALFLEGNALDSLEGLECLKELRCLYVQQNCITHISGLEQLQHLDTLNISHNQLRKLEGLSCCPNLHTLICTNNQLSSLDSVRHLAQCPGLHTLDLQNNDLQDPAILDVVFRQLTELKCLYLKGNPIVSNIKNYRKAVIGALPELTYLDDRPVFPDERRLVQAWLVGGLEAEREERRRIREEEEERNSRNFELMQAIRREGWRKRREREGLPAGDTDPALDDLSDSEWVFEEEPPELVEARQRLAAYTARQGEEEPPELTSARQQRAQAGGSIHAAASGIGSTSDDGAAATTDGQIYLDSVRQAQEELDQNGRQAVPAAASAVGVSSADIGRADAGGSKQQGSSISPAKQAVRLAAGAGPEDDVGVLVSDVMPPLELVGDIDDLAALD